MNAEQKKEALTNSLVSFKIPKKYFIQVANRGSNVKFAIASKGESEHQSIETHSIFLTYDEMNSYLRGYYQAINKPLK